MLENLQACFNSKSVIHMQIFHANYFVLRSLPSEELDEYIFQIYYEIWISERNWVPISYCLQVNREYLGGTTPANN